MMGYDILDAIGGIDPKYIEAAEAQPEIPAASPAKKPRLIKWLAMAACLVLVVGVISAVNSGLLGGGDTGPSTADVSEESESGVTGPAVDNPEENANVETPGEGPKDISSQKNGVVISLDEPHYLSPDELADKAGHIILGEVVYIGTQWRDLSMDGPDEIESAKQWEEMRDDKDLVTAYEIKVSKDYKGDYEEGDTVTLLTFGGDIGSTVYTVEGAPTFRMGESYVFFMNEPSKWEDTMWLLNTYQSSYSEPDVEKNSLKGYFDIDFAWLERYKAKRS